MAILKMADLDLKGKRVLIRADLNVPLKDGKVASDKRIMATLPTIKLALEKGAKVMVISHLGRPEEGVYAEEFSLKPVADYIATKLNGVKVRLEKDYLNGVEVNEGELVVLENCRFNKGEKKNAEDLSKKYAALCDVFVMDAFGTAHRAQATTYGVAQFAPVACAGPLLAAELEALGKAMDNPRPMVAIVGGSKVSTKLPVLNSLLKVCDQLIVGGGIANTFIAAAGHKVGKSLCENDLIDTAKELAAKTQIPEFVDVVVGKEFDEKTPAVTKDLKDVADDDMIFDLGPKSMANINEVIKNAKTILWNGPVGVFEFDQFAAGTKSMADAIANSDAFSVAGGGDTINSIQKFGVTDKISYISTGGGAFLEFVEGKKLPAVEILEKRAAE